LTTTATRAAPKPIGAGEGRRSDFNLRRGVVVMHHAYLAFKREMASATMFISIPPGFLILALVALKMI
jgi:hypothetical protein